MGYSVAAVRNCEVSFFQKTHNYPFTYLQFSLLLHKYLGFTFQCKDTMGNAGEIVQLVNTVNYDGRNMYIRFCTGVFPVAFLNACEK